MPVITGAAIAAVAAVVGIIQALDEAITQQNYQKAMNLKKKYDAIMTKSNLEISEIQRQLNRRNLDLNNVLSKYEGVSRSGKAFQNKNKIEKTILDNQRAADESIKRQEKIQSAATQIYQPKIDKLSNQGGLSTIMNGVTSLIRKE